MAVALDLCEDMQNYSGHPMADVVEIVAEAVDHLEKNLSTKCLEYP